MSPHTKGKEQAPVTLKKTSVEKKQQSVGGGERGGGIADRSHHKGKLNVPMNHIIDVASYWACTRQR